MLTMPACCHQAGGTAMLLPGCVFTWTHTSTNMSVQQTLLYMQHMAEPDTE